MQTERKKTNNKKSMQKEEEHEIENESDIDK
jgi:hypothetical protein